MITTFTELHDRMEGYFRKNIPLLATVDAYREKPDDKIKTPAVLVGMDEMASGSRVTGGRIAMTCIFNAYCLLSSKTPRAELEVRNMAAVVAAAIDGQRWSLDDAVGRPSNITAVPGVFENDQPGIECWIVTWEQEVHLGNVWIPSDLVNDALRVPDPTGSTPIGPDGNHLPPGLEGIYLAGCHDEQHRLEDFPE